MSGTDKNLPNTLGIRVFKRTLDSLIILWNSVGLTDQQKETVKLLVKRNETGEFAVLKFNMIDTPDELNIKKDVVVAVINHKENDLRADQDYLVRLIVGVDQVKEAYLKVSPEGVLPEEERDNKASRVHLMGWNPIRKRWTKLHLVKTKDGGLAIPVKLVE
jgi:hypothetical protein